ncbi:hypothetical protein GSI_07369 [Ganoderma sinense ZZ0214-1]|uniref:Carboxymuconolactone decarboxylase-like domain-containing protein n=1 Tax=Ganoderma sinense ZZ0214-1 TaxID=1077348 RepID=A0A2G8SA85_9APHY|nr:hypothetical protein GSI_07369 [Ganoderma sinense ZZ0214-1]
MADLATPEFLSTLKAAFPPGSPDSPSHLWALIAVVSFSASNVTEAVPVVFKYALDDLVQAQMQAGTSQDVAHAEQLVLARKFRESVLRAGLLCGVPRAIDSLIELHKVMPEHLRDTKPLRDTHKPPAEWDRGGKEVFETIYRETAPSIFNLVDTAYPDLAWFCITVGYGMLYGGTDTLSTIEQIYNMVATLVAVDAPRQIGWHLGNALRNGASLEEARAVRRAALEVAGRAGVKWRGAVPDVEEPATE